MTSTGVTAVEGITCAADPEILPYGTKVLIGGRTFVVQDTGSALRGKKVIDIYVAEPREERYFLDVYIKTPGTHKDK